MDLEKIKKEGNWDDVSDDLNTNFLRITNETRKISDATVRLKGWFSSSAILSSFHPSPIVGDYAYVGLPFPGYVYKCEEKGVWIGTREVPQVNHIDVEEFVNVNKNQDVWGAKTFHEGVFVPETDRKNGAVPLSQMEGYAITSSVVTDMKKLI